MIVNLPSSQGGLNLKDSLDAMDIRYAIQMDNILPDTNRDVLRGGCKLLTDTPANTLMTFNQKGDEALLFSYEGDVYKLNSDNTETLLQAGFTNDDWQYCSFTDGGGNVNTVLTNGVDNVQRVYDDNGTLTMASTYNSATSLNSPCAYKYRMYFAVNDTLP